jgi:hypothetical protein
LGKGKRLIVLHAGTRSEGLIDGCDLVLLAKSKDGDYHQEMNSVVFLEWFENQLMPALKNPSLVVLDNASYHNVKTEDTVCPNFGQKKAVLQNYLTFLFLLLIPKKFFVIFPKAPYVSSLASFNRKVVLFLATKPLTCASVERGFMFV